MKVSLKWLKTMVDVPADVRELTERLDLTGTAVEGFEATGAVLDGIVTGQILTREKHPDADKLWVTTVDVGAHNLGDDGEPKPLQIVCGAQNFVAGDKVPVALIGAVLPDGTKIKKAKMRGVESCGMNCSARELSMGDDHAGLLILPPHTLVGVPIAEHLGLGDTVIELEITPNRPDCMSMLGVAREVGAVYERPFRVGREVGAPPVGGPVEGLVRVSIEDAERCPRYTARVVRGVRVGPSPDWLVERIVAAGGRSINNIVDVTNYIMFELGQPLHAFDLDTLAKDADGRAHIVVRAAAEGERFTTLDGIERRLDGDITCIVDGNAVGEVGAAGAGAAGEAAAADPAGRTIALAGVMGGLLSEVTDGTTNILLESATFSTAHTSRTSRKLQLFSESSARYERGVDAATCDEFSARAAALMVEVAGGEACEGVIDVWPMPAEPQELTLRVKRLQDFIGAPITAAEAASILTRLGCVVREQPVTDMMGVADAQPDAPRTGTPTPPTLAVLIPSFRPDLTREIDLYEEVLRVWGMSRVASTLPGGRGRIGEQTLEQRRMAVIGRALRACGLNETMTYAFASLADDAVLAMPFEEHQQPVELINPMNSEQGLMRRSILAGLLRAVAYNQSRGVANVHLYETGTVFFATEGRKLPKERQMLAGVLAGSWTEGGWNDSAVPLDFFDGKGVIENLLRELNIVKTRFKPLEISTEATEAPWLQPGRAARVMAGSTSLGWLGEVHPRVCAAFEATPPLVAFELEIKPLLACAEQARPYRDVPQFPAVTLDLALVVNEDVSAERVGQVIRSAAGTLLDELRLFDVYRDEEKIGIGRKSLAFALAYRASDRTLTIDEVDKLHQKVIGKVTAAVGGEIRS
ncbi:MAG: phenylalanine--tRNA ligase subunit beta [Coriobacteriales bacterium]|jgi:phenylalanyl-tRNA synthetase beta chain|nr:phenylalanine--tRNA ligase subunit beta [Coriobacteriales bacterium]